MIGVRDVMEGWVDFVGFLFVVVFIFLCGWVFFRYFVVLCLSLR